MAYVQGGTIDAADFNTFRTQILNVYGVGNGDSGYGQTAITVPSVAGGNTETIKSAEWTNLRNAIGVCAQHQGTASALLPPTTVLEVGDTIVAHDGITNAYNFPQMLTDITTNRLNTDATATSVVLAKSTQSVSNSWNNLASTVVDITWPTADEARYFFNTGGQIIIRSDRTGGATTDQNTSWTDLLNAVGSVVIAANTTTGTGSTGTGSAYGYHTLTTASASVVFTASPTAAGTYDYSPNVYRVSAQMLNVNGTNGDNGNTMRITIEWDDNYTASTDTVDGTLSVYIDERRASTYVTTTAYTPVINTAMSAA